MLLLCVMCGVVVDNDVAAVVGLFDCLIVCLIYCRLTLAGPDLNRQTPPARQVELIRAACRVCAGSAPLERA